MMRQENDLVKYLTARQERPLDRHEAARQELRRALEDGTSGRPLPHIRFLADQLGEPGPNRFVNSIVQRLAD